MMSFTFDGSVVSAGHDVLSGRVEVGAAHEAGVAAQAQRLAGREGLQVARRRQLGHQVVRPDGQPHLDGARRQVQVQAAQEALAREALVGRHLAQARVARRQERVLALPRRLAQLVPLFQLKQGGSQ